jgi:hypothetical protein
MKPVLGSLVSYGSCMRLRKGGFLRLSLRGNGKVNLTLLPVCFIRCKVAAASSLDDADSVPNDPLPAALLTSSTSLCSRTMY